VQGTRALMARASWCRARTCAGFVLTYGFALQDKQHGKGRATRGKALVPDKGNPVEAPGERYLACRYHCRLSASTELATREVRPSRMAKISPSERTVASGETCLGEETRLERRLCARIQCPWCHPQSGAPPFLAASQNSSLFKLAGRLREASY